jgi:hypothetical protein
MAADERMVQGKRTQGAGAGHAAITYACACDTHTGSAAVRWFAGGFCGALEAAGLRRVRAADSPDLRLEVLDRRHDPTACHAANGRPGTGVAVAVDFVRTPVVDPRSASLLLSARSGLDAIVLVLLAPTGTQAWLVRSGGPAEHIASQASDDLFLARLRERLLDFVRAGRGLGGGAVGNSDGRRD